MAAGDVLPAERRTRRDPFTGATVHQLTDWRAHSHHLYFTNSGLWDDGRRLLVGSDRDNATNLYSVDLESGGITQLTDFAPSASLRAQTAFLNPARDEACFVCDRSLIALDLRTCRQRELFRTPEGYTPGNLSCTADGRTICHVLHQDLGEAIYRDFGYTGFREYSAARPHCMILGIDVDSGADRLLYEEDFWLGHINTSPALTNILTFCHEGPWDTIDQRMWRLDVSTGQAEPLRPQVPGEAIGHEYWLCDGLRVGYHGRKDGVHRFGVIRWDGADGVEYDFPHGSTHFHSMDEGLIVGDGGRGDPYLLLWRLRGGEYDGPRRLAWHRGSFHVQVLHVHPRMFADAAGATRVVYTSDHNGYGNVFIADV
ncbi:MAG: oligogalacturonate lyase family protein, partial [Phycisphaerae bacterium]